MISVMTRGFVGGCHTFAVADDELELLILSIIGAVVALIVCLTKGTRRVTEPECAKCGYCVQGLPTQICPECGSNLREVGVFEPGMRRPSGTRRLAILLWTVLLPLPAWIVSGSLYTTLVPWSHKKTTYRVIIVQTNESWIHIIATMEGRIERWGSSSAGIPLQHMQLLLDDRVGPTLSIDPDKRVFAYHAKGVTVEGKGDLNTETITGWLAAAGVDTSGGLSRQGIRDLLQAIKQISLDFSASSVSPTPLPARSPFVTVGPMSESISSSPAWSSRIVWPVMFFFWSFVWWLGISLGLRRARSCESSRSSEGG